MSEIDGGPAGNQEQEHDAVGSYVLNALDAAERHDFEAHLATCSRCREDVRSFEETMAQLGETLEVAPPASLRAGVLQAIAGVEQLPASTSTGTSGRSSTDEPDRGVTDITPRHAAQAAADNGSDNAADNAADPEADPGDGSRDDVAARDGGNVVPIDRARRRGPRIWIAVAAVAAVIALAAGFSAVGLNRQLQQQQTASQQLSSREAQLLSAPDAKIYISKLRDGTPVSYVVSKQRNSAMLVGADVTGPGNGRTYQLWTVRVGAGKSQSFYRDTTFGAGANQRVFMTGDVSRADILGITVEPAGGSNQPTTKPFALATL